MGFALYMLCLLTITQVIHNSLIKYAAAITSRIIQKEVNMIVLLKPMIVDIKNITRPYGNEVKLECRATGYIINYNILLSSPKKMVGGHQPADDRIAIERCEDRERNQVVGALTISNLATSDDGFYVCIAENKEGEVRQNGNLTVKYPPAFPNTPMKEAWSRSQQAVNLTCLAEAIPNATISWKFNDREIGKDQNFKKIGNGPQSTLIVTPVDQYYYGIYKCVAKNAHGEAFHTISLQETQVPSETLQTRPRHEVTTSVNYMLISNWFNKILL